MPLSFDDLVPASAAPASPSAPSGGGLSFDDLIPQAQQQTAQASGTAPVKSTFDLLMEGLPKLPGQIYEGLKSAVTYPGDVYAGNATVPQSANMPGGEQTADIGRALGTAQLMMPLSEVGGMTKPAPFKAPSENELQASATSRYQSPEVLNLRLKPEAGEDLSNIIKTDLKAAKLDQFNGKSYYDIADRLKKPRFGENLTLDDLEAARQDSVAPPATATPADKRGSQVIRDAIDNYLGNIPENHVLSGDAKAANETLTKARADFAALKRSQETSAALTRAEHQAASTYSGHNLDNATRQQLRPILNQKTGVSKSKAFQNYTPEEIDALTNAVNGSFLGNQARALSNRLGGGGGHGNMWTGFGTGVAAHELGADPVTAFVLGLGSMAGGRALRAGANALASGRGNTLAELLRSRSALADEMRAAGPSRVPVNPFVSRLPTLAMPGLGVPYPQLLNQPTY